MYVQVFLNKTLEYYFIMHIDHSEEFKAHRIGELVTVRHRDVVSDGFGLTDVADAGVSYHKLKALPCGHRRYRTCFGKAHYNCCVK